jgi:hypothetical protein
VLGQIGHRTPVNLFTTASCTVDLFSWLPSTDWSCKNRIRDRNATTRATVVAAIRFTFTDTSQAYDELLSPLIVDFLSLMVDKDLVSLIPLPVYHH